MAEKVAFNTILSISGKPGLYKVISRNKGAVIVESLADGRKSPVYASHKVISLSDITMYTQGDDMPLREILHAIERLENAGPSVGHNASEEDLRGRMAKAVPTYDADRVYASDLKKLFMWYNILQSSGNLPETETQAEEAQSEE